MIFIQVFFTAVPLKEDDSYQWFFHCSLICGQFLQIIRQCCQLHDEIFKGRALSNTWSDAMDDNVCSTGRGTLQERGRGALQASSSIQILHRQLPDQPARAAASSRASCPAGSPSRCGWLRLFFICLIPTVLVFYSFVLSCVFYLVRLFLSPSK